VVVQVILFIVGGQILLFSIPYGEKPTKHNEHDLHDSDDNIYNPRAPAPKTVADKHVDAKYPRILNLQC
jgi:hypothetical protein